ncbi:NAD(P)-binding domain-containing protein [Amycolatopsis sp. NPDC023774]|uniref:flavin-containing monooxygenase n=1 Tax=Amycolatopsis sp. NPDC023774 TaxID=3155015 RepID=UPI003410CBEB
MNEHERTETVVIGAGQAGLSAGYHLARRDRDFVVLDGNEQIGDNWRCHWDTLRLFTPALAAGLPGMAYPGPPMHYATKDEMAGYLATYAHRFALPVRGGQRVARVSRTGTGFEVTTPTTTFTCDNVVVATGTFGRAPRVPEFAGRLDPGIRQLHSSEYRNPEQLRPGPVLVVGASHSGGDIAFEAARAGHRVVLSGPIRGELPFDINRRPARVLFPVLFFAAKHILTMRTPWGRMMRPEIRTHGGPLIRIKRADLVREGVEHVADRTTGIRGGAPVLADGRVLDVANVVWCTGFRQDFSWIDPPVTDESGWPREERGVAITAPGLYFVGLSFQWAFSSMLVGGAGRDAEYVVKHLTARTEAAAGKRIGSARLGAGAGGAGH